MFGILLVGVPAHAAEENESAFLGGVWKDAVINLAWNPEGFPEWFSSPNPYFQPEYPSPVPFATEEERTEYRRQVWELVMRLNLAQINQLPKSSLRINYLGRTTARCDDFTDGVVVICWADESHSWVKPITRAQVHYQKDGRGEFIIDAAVYFRSVVPGPGGEFGYPESTAGQLSLHEVEHVTGLKHFGTGNVISEGSITKVLQPDEIAAISYLYPFDLDRCEVRLTSDFVLELSDVWVGDEMYQVVLKLFDADNLVFELVSAEIQDEPVSDCGFKFVEKDQTIHIPSVWYDSLIPEERARYEVDIQLVTDQNTNVRTGPRYLFKAISGRRL